MPSTAVSLFKELHAELVTLLPGIPVDRRYMPRQDGKELDTLRVSLYLEATQHDEIARGIIESDRWTFGIAVQQNAIEQVGTDSEGDPVLDGIDNLANGDAVIELVETIKDFWRSGPLRDLHLGGCRYVELTHDPIYEPYHLVAYGVFSSIIDVTYETTA